MGVCQVSFGILPGHRKNLLVLLTVLHPQWPNPSNKRLMDLSKPMNGRKWKTKHCDVQFVNPNVHTKYIHTNSYNCRQSIRCNYTYTRACVYNIWLFPKISVSAKRVASGGMFRGMFRRYVSEVCFGVCFALPG